MHKRKSDLLFLLASLAGVGGIVASLLGTSTMTYVAFGLLGTGAVLVAAGVVADRVRSASLSGHQRSGQAESRESPPEEVSNVGHTRQ